MVPAIISDRRKAFQLKILAEHLLGRNHIEIKTISASRFYYNRETLCK